MNSLEKMFMHNLGRYIKEFDCDGLIRTIEYSSFDFAKVTFKKNQDKEKCLDFIKMFEMKKNLGSHKISWILENEILKTPLQDKSEYYLKQLEECFESVKPKNPPMRTRLKTPEWTKVLEDTLRTFFLIQPEVKLIGINGDQFYLYDSFEETKCGFSTHSSDEIGMFSLNISDDLYWVFKKSINNYFWKNPFIKRAQC